MPVAYIALGSNLGDRAGHIRAALARLGERPGVTVERVSRLYETHPVASPPGSPRYLNAAAVLTTTLDPLALLDVLLEVEADLGRDRPAGVANAPRTIDLDLLTHEQSRVESNRLTLPHPRMTERQFVLVPLAELVPDARHPIAGETYATLLRRLRETEGGPQPQPWDPEGHALRAEPSGVLDRLFWPDLIAVACAALLALIWIPVNLYRLLVTVPSWIGQVGRFFGPTWGQVAMLGMLAVFSLAAAWGTLRLVVLAWRAGLLRPRRADACGFAVETTPEADVA